jgi:plasmid stabilization system protein ParE
VTRQLRIQPLAELDVIQAHAWYESQRTGLGDELLDFLDQCFESVLQNPLGYQPVYRETLRALLRRFPYCVYFMVSDIEVVVIAVLHARRSATVWRSRL